MTEVFDRTKRGTLFASILVLIVALSAATGTAAAQSAPDCSTVTYNGDGTEANPYEVGEVDQLQCIEEQDLGANYRQVADIDASGTSMWNGGDGFDPIAEFGFKRDTGFNGTFDGADYTVSGLTIDRGSAEALGLEVVGLFGVVGTGGGLENVTLENVDITGDVRVGGLVGLNRGTVRESYATGSVSGEDEFAGGLAGANAGTIERSYANASVSGSSSVGGLVGGNIGNVTESYAIGNVSGTDDVGGLVGSNGGTVTESYATGDVSDDTDVGGLVGRNDFPYPSPGTVTESYWDTESTGQSTSDGGATGLTTSEMTGDAAANNMQGFDFTNTWKTVPDDYPMLTWQTGGNRGTNTIDSDSNGDGEGDGGTDGRNGGSSGADGENAAENSSGTEGTEGLPGFTIITGLLALLTVVAAGVRRETK